MHVPNFGDRVVVWPADGHRVQDGDGRYGMFLPADGREVEWDCYWHRRYLDGAVHLHHPRPRAAVTSKA